VARRPDPKVFTLLITAAIGLPLQRYVGKRDMNEPIGCLLRWLGCDRTAEFMFDLAREVPEMQLDRLTWWVCVGLVANVVIPMSIIHCVFRERFRDYPLKLPRAFPASFA